MNLRQLALVGLAGVALCGIAAGQTSAETTTPAQVAQASPTAAPATPSPAPSGRPRRRAASPEPSGSPSETPEPPQFQTMDGVWEVASQPMDGSLHVKYSHLFITQKGDQLTGTWVRSDKDSYSFTGTFDGRLFKLTLANAKGVTYTMSGYAENYGDMVGLLISSDPKDKGLPFTAAHRKKEKLG